MVRPRPDTQIDGQTTVPSGIFTAVAAGGNDELFHGLGIRSGGTLAGWGDNQLGQIAVPAGTFIAVAAGYYHSVAIRTDGTLAGWGSDAQGQMTGFPMSETFIAVGANSYYSLAIRSNGTLVGWGNNFAGQTDVPSGTYSVFTRRRFTLSDVSIFIPRRNGRFWSKSY